MRRSGIILFGIVLFALAGCGTTNRTLRDSKLITIDVYEVEMLDQVPGEIHVFASTDIRTDNGWVPPASLKNVVGRRMIRVATYHNKPPVFQILVDNPNSACTHLEDYCGRIRMWTNAHNRKQGATLEETAVEFRSHKTPAKNGDRVKCIDERGERLVDRPPWIDTSCTYSDLFAVFAGN